MNGYDPTVAPFYQLVGNGFMSPQRSDSPTINEFNDQLTLAVMTAFSNVLPRRGSSHETDRRRKIARECGHPEIITLDMYEWAYRRNAVANRAISIWPRECWQVSPEVTDDEDPDAETEFKSRFADMVAGLRTDPAGKPSRYRSESGKGNALWSYCKRLHEQSGIGHYGVLLLGFDDISPDEVRQQTTGTEGPGPLAREVVPSPTRRLLFVRVFPESRAAVATWDENLASPRYGQPLTYSINFGNPQDMVSSGTTSPAQDPGSQWSATVHWTRVIHFTISLRDNEVFAPPILEAIFDNVLDHKKLVASSAEMYWQGALPGWAAETDPGLGGTPRVNWAKAKDMFENYINTLQRFVIANGFTMKSLAPQVVSPRDQIDVQIETICIQIGVPVPVFQGYEIGEQASTNNDADMNDRTKEVQENVLTPGIIVPLVDRCMWAGVLPDVDEYTCKWPDIYVMSDEMKAKIGLTLTQALTAYVQGGGENVLALMDFFTKFLRFSDDEARTMADNVEQAMQEVLDRRETLTPPELQGQGGNPPPTPGEGQGGAQGDPGGRGAGNNAPPPRNGQPVKAGAAT